MQLNEIIKGLKVDREVVWMEKKTVLGHSLKAELSGLTKSGGDNLVRGRRDGYWVGTIDSIGAPCIPPHQAVCQFLVVGFLANGF